MTKLPEMKNGEFLPEPGLINCRHILNVPPVDPKRKHSAR